jgi:hypothetical protein
VHAEPIATLEVVLICSFVTLIISDDDGRSKSMTDDLPAFVLGISLRDDSLVRKESYPRSAQRLAPLA